jgi:hypothetical protein
MENLILLLSFAIFGIESGCLVLLAEWKFIFAIE